MKYLRQVVPLGQLQSDGKTVLITRMFGDDIEKLATSTVTQTVEDADLSALQAQVNEQAILINSLVLANIDLTERVHKLETGYQS